jgi:hypothetical protein
VAPAANVTAMLIQYLPAKPGIAADRNLAENFRAHYRAAGGSRGGCRWASHRSADGTGNCQGTQQRQGRP